MEGGFTPETAINHSLYEKEKTEIEIKKSNLGDSIGYRIALDDKSRQEDLIKVLRGQGIISFPEDEKTALGYIRSQEELRQFVDLVKTYDGEVGFGGSFGDSRVWLVKGQDDKDRFPIVATSSATNAAARVVHGGLGTRLDQLTPDSIFIYRYADSNQITPSVQIVEGAKKTLLERISIDATSLPETYDVQRMTDEDRFVHGHLTENLETKKKVLEHATALAVLSIDASGFSLKIHEYAKQGQLSQAEKYLESIVNFLLRLENNVDQAVKQLNSTGISHNFEWRGDAGGVMVDSKYAVALQLAFEKTLEEMGNQIAVKASIFDAENINLTKSSIGLHLDATLNEKISTFEETMKDKLKDQAPSSSLLDAKMGTITTYDLRGHQTLKLPV